MPTRERVLLLGATGATGQLTLRHLLDLGISTTVAGRSADKLAALAGDAGLRTTVVRIDDREGLIRAFAGHSAVVNCAGPFLRNGTAPVEAALEARIHYLDTSWEQAHLFRLAGFDEDAKKRGIAVISGIGVSPGVSDLLVAIGSRHGGGDPLESVAVHYVEGLGNQFSYGSLLSTAEMLKASSYRLADGVLVPMRVGEKRKTVKFPGRLGMQRLMLYPGADVAAVSRSYQVREVEHYFGAQWFTGVIGLLGRLPFNPDSLPVRSLCLMAARLQGLVPGGRPGFAQVVEVRSRSAHGSRACRVDVCGDEPYETTARLLAISAAKLVLSGSAPTGVVSPGRAFDPDELLDAIGLTAVVTADPG